MDDTLLDGAQSVNITASAANYQSASTGLTVLDYETLALSFALPAISESGGSTTGTVTRTNTDIAAALTVQLQSLDESEATVPNTITIPAGQASATFTITAVDDQIQDGTQAVAIRASAAGYIDGTQAIDVIDSVALSLSIAPPDISEKGGTATATVTRSNTNTESALTVLLASSDVSEGTVPVSVTIPAGQSSATFVVTAVDDSLLDGSQTISISATANGYAGASRALTVKDFEELRIELDAGSISEAGGATRGRVSRLNSDLGQSITVQLTSRDMSEALVPVSVVIPANQTSVAFDISAIDDTLLDGTQSVTLIANSAGYESSQVNLLVTDREDIVLELSAGSMSEFGGFITATVRRSNTDIDQLSS